MLYAVYTSYMTIFVALNDFEHVFLVLPFDTTMKMNDKKEKAEYIHFLFIVLFLSLLRMTCSIGCLSLNIFWVFFLSHILLYVNWTWTCTFIWDYRCWFLTFYFQPSLKYLRTRIRIHIILMEEYIMHSWQDRNMCLYALECFRCKIQE